MTSFEALALLFLLSTGCLVSAKLAVDQGSGPVEAAGAALFLLGGAGYCGIVFRLWQATYGGYWAL